VLNNPDKTANKYLSTASFNVSVAEIVETIESLTGSKFTINREDSRKVQKVGEEKLSKGDYSAFRELVRVWNFADGAGHALKPEGSLEELLGIPSDDLTRTIKAWLTKAGAL
jgi:hypothetical protein